ncbi:hypothetical protein QQX98_012136 [Neonectria punicea]|uniref:Uncharacterized protein n=1 Tax=Neonectria punicea TaxID=979145 RepID=A0ABR1GJN9_9HYPO
MLAKIRWRPSTFIFGVFLLSTIILGLLISPLRPSTSFQAPWATDTADVSLGNVAPKAPPPKRGYHLLMPATQSGIGLCKTLLTMAILGYPKPRIIGWGDEDDHAGLKGGGSHYAKISRGLEYVMDETRRQDPTFDDDLIILFDAYDIWFQLPWETLVARYDAAIAEENERVAHRMGRAAIIENITSSVIFAGGKRCCPNQRQSVACYPIPDSPLPDDLHGGATDTVLGRTSWSSFRTRYLIGGYLIGPIGKVRPLLQRAQAKMDECMSRRGAWYDGNRDGSDGTVNFCYRGSDQSIWAEVLGEQEFHREVMRRRHRKHIDDVLDAIIPNLAGSKPPPTNVMGTVVDDLLNPSFQHQEWDPGYLPNKPYEYGMAIDYWSLLGHQTVNSVADARYVRNNISFEEQVGPLHMFDCKAKPANVDVLLQEGLLNLVPGEDWRTLSMYTEICLGIVPVMIHHNFPDKSQIKKQWHKTWWFGYARRLFENRFDEGLPMLVEGIPSDKGDTLMWADLCPVEYESELFRDVTKEEEAAGVEEEEGDDGAWYKNADSKKGDKIEDGKEEVGKKGGEKKGGEKKEGEKKEGEKKEGDKKGSEKEGDKKEADKKEGDKEEGAKLEDEKKEDNKNKGEGDKNEGDSNHDESSAKDAKTEDPPKEEPAIDESHHEEEDSQTDQPPADNPPEDQVHHDEENVQNDQSPPDSSPLEDLQEDEHTTENTHDEPENGKENESSEGDSPHDDHVADDLPQDGGLQEDEQTMDEHHDEDDGQDDQPLVEDPTKDESHHDDEDAPLANEPHHDDQFSEADHIVDGSNHEEHSQQDEHAVGNSHHDEDSQQDEHVEADGQHEQAPTEGAPRQDSQSDSQSGNP